MVRTSTIEFPELCAAEVEEIREILGNDVIGKLLLEGHGLSKGKQRINKSDLIRRLNIGKGEKKVTELIEKLKEKLIAAGYE